MKTQKVFTMMLFLMITSVSYSQHYHQNLTLEQRVIQSDLVIEGKVVESKSYYDRVKEEIYTVHKVKIYKQFKGDDIGKEMSVTTIGGRVGDTTYHVFHSQQIHSNEMGIFFLKQNNLVHNQTDFPITNFSFSVSQSFLKYLDNNSNKVVQTKYESYYNIEKDLLSKIELITGERIVQNLTDKEQELQDWIAKQKDNSNTENSIETIVEYTIENPFLSGAFNEFLEFDINIQSLLTSEEFFSGELLIEYNSLTFGTNLAASGNLTLTKGTVISAPNYTIGLTDIAPNKIEILVVSNTSNPNSLHLIDSQSEQLLHLKIDISNLAGNTDIDFDEINMQGLTEFFDISQTVLKPFDLVKADDELDIDISSFIAPQIYDFYPKTVRGGIDTITIIGTGFGTFENFSGGGTYVEFTNSINGPMPVEWIRPHHREYALWTDTMIVVKVTSFGANHPDWLYQFGKYVAGTGKIRVRTSNGVSNQSSSILTVQYSIFNEITNDNGVFRPAPVLLIDGNGQGGYTVSYDTSFINYTGATDAFERALRTWRCATGVNYIINDSVPNTPSGNELIVKFDSSVNLASTGLWLIPDCPGSPNSYMRKFTMKFNPSFFWHTDTTQIPLPNADDQDLETTALHEIGHTHLLNHTNDILTVMWWEQRDGLPFPVNNYFRTIDQTGLLGGNYIMDISAINPPVIGTCLTPMQIVPFNECGIINSNKEIIPKIWVNLYPNPFQENLNIQLSQFEKDLTLSILDLQGRFIHNEAVTELNTSINLSHLPTGMYFVIIQSPRGKTINKIIKL